MSSPPSTAVEECKFTTNNTHLLLFYISRTTCGADQAAPASAAQLPQQPPCFLEDEEEEIYLSESMQEITDGDITHSLYQRYHNSKHANRSDVGLSPSNHPGAPPGPVCSAGPAGYLHCHHHREACTESRVVQGRTAHVGEFQLKVPAKAFTWL